MFLLSTNYLSFFQIWLFRIAFACTLRFPLPFVFSLELWLSIPFLWPAADLVGRSMSDGFLGKKDLALHMPYSRGKKIKLSSSL